MLPVLQIGPLALRTPALLLLLGAYLGLSLAERRIPRGGPAPNQLYNLAFIGLVAGILTARLSFAAQHFAVFSPSPLNLFSLDAALLDPFVGVVVALISMLLYGQHKKLAFWPVLDAFTPVLAITAVFLGFAHLASGAAYGTPTSMPWAIELWGAYRHPSQVYESLFAIAILAVLWRKFGKGAVPGRIFLLFVTASAAARLLLDAWRGDAVFTLGGLRLAQGFAWVVMALGVWLLDRKDQVNRRVGSLEEHG